MAEAVKKPIRSDYDEANDVLFVEFAKDTEATTHSFGGWLVLRVSTKGLRLLALQINGFKELLSRVEEYTRKHAGRIRDAHRHMSDLEFSYDKASDVFWGQDRSWLKARDQEPVEERRIDDNIIVYWSHKTGRVVAAKIPEYSRRWYSVLKRTIESFTREVLMPTSDDATPAFGQSELIDELVQFDMASLREYAKA